MATEALLEDFVGKTVKAVILDDAGVRQESKEYKVEAANGGFYILREKGRSAPHLVPSLQIESFEVPEPKPVLLKAKRLKPVDDSAVKRHLLDTHGYKVGDINGISQEQAVALHESIDHQEIDLGHFHGLSPKEEKIAAAGEVQTEIDFEQGEDGFEPEGQDEPDF